MLLPNSLSRQPNRKTIWLFAGYCLTLVVWKTALWLYLPLPATDGVQSLSHTYSILRGDFFHSVFWHNWMDLFQLPYGYGLATAPLMRLLPFGSLHNFYAASLVFSLLSAVFAYALLSRTRHSKGFAALAAVALFAYPQLWVLRPESITVPLLLFSILLLRHYHEQPRPILLLGAAFFIVFAGLTHPIGGLIGVLMVTLTALEKGWRWKYLLTFYGLCGLWLALMYLPIILINVELWLENFLGFFTREEPRGLSTLAALRSELLRFVGWGAPLLLLWVRGWTLSWRQPGWSLVREVLFAALFAIPILLGGNGAYFAYLLVFIIWRLAALPRAVSVTLPVTAVVLIAAPFWTHYFPTFQTLENPAFGENVRAILNQVDRYSQRTEPGMIWVSTRIGLPIIDETYSRVLANYYALGRYRQPIPLNEGDEILYMWSDEAEIIFSNYAVTPETMQTETLVPPVPGLLTFESLLRERLPPVGLWRVTARR